MRTPHQMLRDRRGIALPLALFGLVVMSLLVTTALITSSTEAALSVAHQQGAQGLYRAEQALEGYIGDRAVRQQDPANRLVAGDDGYVVGDGTPYTLRRALLAQVALQTQNQTARRRDVYSLVASPAGGRGRSVGTLVDVLRERTAVQLQVDAGLTLGVNTTISGNATISNGSDGGAACDSADAQHAITHSNDVSLTVSGNAADTIGGAHEVDMSAAELMSHVFNGETIDEVADNADIQFGSRFQKDGFSNTNGPANDASQSPYRWGCPSRVIRAANKSVATECGAHADTSFFPVVAIDAGGGQVEITGEHAQGTIVVVNGDLRIRGNFMFQGVIVTEGKLTVEGTPRIEGAVIAMGDETVIQPDDSGTTTGNSVIRFNRCELANAQNGMSQALLDIADQQFDTPTYSWFEVVR